MQKKPKITSSDIQQDFHNLLAHPSVDKIRHPKNSYHTKSTLILLSQFKDHLCQKRLTPKTIKNYVSDIRGFLNHLKDLPTEKIDFIGYPSVLIAQNTPRSTVNRKIASLKKFAHFLHLRYSFPKISHKIKNIPQDPIENITKNFRYFLTKKKHKSKTISNYISDIKHYLEWATNES